MQLSDLANNQKAVITRVLGHGSFRKRITEMGFVKGKEVTVIKNAPLQDPIEYEIMGYHVSLRRAEASLIEIAMDNYNKTDLLAYEGTIIENRLKISTRGKTKTIQVALVGNPNSGKTTLFNLASGLHERVGNYGGVTIEAKEATFRKDKYTLKITDLPGTYSITEYTPEELFVRKHILENKPDIVINVVDGSNLERNLLLTTQLIDMNIKVIIALNMYDEMQGQGIMLDHLQLARLLGIPVVPTVAVKGQGLQELLSKIIEVYEDRDPVVRHIHINYGSTIEESISRIQGEIRKSRVNPMRLSTRYLAIKLLENDKTTKQSLLGHINFDRIEMISNAEIQKLEKEFREKAETTIIDAKYGFIAGALGETCTRVSGKSKKKWVIDDLLTHKYWGFPIFFAFLWLMFQATFSLGNYPMEWIDAGVAFVGGHLSSIIPDGPLHDLIIDGIIGGVGGVIIFLPNILILFFFISVMEDTGYMARVSFIMDKLMHKMGLHGKSFIPLIMGFGCNVPAVMATRTLENRKDRIITMLVTPFMSCSARLPVYVLIISAFFTRHQGLVLFSIYIFGIVLAIAVALLLKRTMFSRHDVPFVMELPKYRIPTLTNSFTHMWFKGSQYLRKMGTVILMASILIWALSYYPRKVKYSLDYDAQTELINKTVTDEKERTLQVNALELKKVSEHQEQSYIGRLGRYIEPAIQPLGFDWKIGISIITGLAAKEIVVGSMGVLYHAELEANEQSGSLIKNLQQQVHSSGKLEGQKVFTPLVAFGFMLFVLIYFPCVAVIAAIKKESNWKYALFAMFYTTALAWLVAFITYQAGNLITKI